MPNGIPRPIKILVVDDDTTQSHAVELRLSKAGFFPQTAGSGELALAILAEQKFDLVVLDLVMPGMAGFDVLRELRQKNITVPVVVLSMLRQEEDMRLAKELGAHECFAKNSPTFMEDIVHYAETLSTA